MVESLLNDSRSVDGASPRRFRPTYAGANVGHPSAPLTAAALMQSSFARVATVFGFTSHPLERRVVPGPLTTVFGFTSCFLERRVPHVRTSVRGTKTMFFECFHLIAHLSFIRSDERDVTRRYRF